VDSRGRCTFGARPAHRVRAELSHQRWECALLDHLAGGIRGIDASNGDLHLEVPLVTLPQRATAKPFAVTLAYDSRIWESSIGSWVADNVYQSTMGGWRLVTSAGTGGGIEHSTLRTKCYLGDPGQYYYKYSSFEWLDPSGTYRHFPINTEYDPWNVTPTTERHRICDRFLRLSDGGHKLHNRQRHLCGGRQSSLPKLPRYERKLLCFDWTDTLGRTPVAVTTNCNGYSYEICYDVPTPKEVRRDILSRQSLSPYTQRSGSLA